MWDFFMKIQSYNITPDQYYYMLSIYKKVSLNTKMFDLNSIRQELMNQKLIEFNKIYSITDEGVKVINNIDLYYKKKTIQKNKKLMGNDFESNVIKYREIFPAIKLPSGKLARNNVKTLTENFKWFFATYDHNWDKIFKATKNYVNEYMKKDWQYMKTSQYFISKQDKHRVKVSDLADYCDLINEGIRNEDDFFRENIV